MSKIKSNPNQVSRPQFLDLPRQIVVLKAKDRSYRFHKDRLVIGSVESADLKLAGEGIAPIHAVIEVINPKPGDVLPEGVPPSGGVVIYDLASETGVFVNGKKTITQVIQSKDQIQIGRWNLEVNLESPDSAKSSAKSLEGRSLMVDPKLDMGAMLLETEGSSSDLFDFAPSSQISLEVVMSWRSSILNIEHFLRNQTVVVGSDRSADFGIPPILSNSRFPFVEAGAEGWTLNVDPKMKGVIQRSGRLFTLDQAVSGSSGKLHLTDRDFAKITLGEVDFYLSFTPAPPRLKTRRIFERDPLFLQVLGGSMAASVALVMSFSKMTISPAIEAEQLPERIATILYKPEAYTSKVKQFEPKREEPKPIETEQPKQPDPEKVTKIDVKPTDQKIDPEKQLPKIADYGKKTEKQNQASKTQGTQGKNAQSESKQGAGAKAKGESGTRGGKTSKNTGDPQQLAKRTSPTGGDGRGSGASQVRQEGNMDLMKGIGGKIENLLGNSAEKLGKGGKSLEGFGGFMTRGQGGLALDGEGKGGGGTADSLGGLAKSGRGGGRVGTGLGATGSGAGIVGGKTRVVIRSGGPEETVVMGAIDADAVERALLAHKDEFRLCYEKEINAENPGASGRVGTSFVIGSSGHVTQAGIESSSLKNANVERCILAVIKRIDFPIPRGGGVVQVTYPFKFSSSPR
ncbi:MAG: TonB family protein [Bdellovibrionales bacterium]|nr:TonB family protein [Bdellovibrionales bacterium]